MWWGLQHWQFADSKAFCAIDLVRLLKATLYDKVVAPVPQLIVVGQVLPCALAFEQLAGPSGVQLHSFASCVQHIDRSLDQLPKLDTLVQAVTISLLAAGVKLPVSKCTVTATFN